MAKEIPVRTNEVLTPTDHKLVIQRNPRFTIKWWKDNHDLGPRDARCAIRQMMEHLQISVNAKPIKLDALKAITEKEEITKNIHTEARFEGVVWALCQAKQSGVSVPTDTGYLWAGAPVVLDTTTGYTLTGIADSWLPDEYTILGTALVGSTTSGMQELPVLLHKQHHVQHAVYTALLLEDWLGTGQPYIKAVIVGQPGRGFNPSGSLDTWEDDIYAVKIRNNLGSQGLIGTAGNYFPTLRRRTLVNISFDAYANYWQICTYPYHRPGSQGTLVQALVAGGTAQFDILGYLPSDDWLTQNPGSSFTTDRTWRPTGERQTVVDFHLPPQLTIPAGTRISVRWDADSLTYVLTGVNELNYYGTALTMPPP